MKVGFFGGSFDPPALSHMIIATQAVDQLDLDLLFLMPTGESVSATDKTTVASAEERYDMAIIAAEECGGAVYVSGIESKKKGPTRTIDTIRELYERSKEEESMYADPTEVWFLFGADSWNDLPNWEEPEEIMERVRIAVIPRAGVDLRLGYDRLLDIPAMGLSSTWIRKLIKEGRSTQWVLSESIQRYIKATGLYT